MYTYIMSISIVPPVIDVISISSDRSVRCTDLSTGQVPWIVENAHQYSFFRLSPIYLPFLRCISVLCSKKSAYVSFIYLFLFHFDLLILPRSPVNAETVCFESVLATGSDDGDMCVWDLRKSSPIFKFHEHGDYISDLYYDSSSGYLLSSRLNIFFFFTS